MYELLGGESDTVAVERFNHFAVGWVDYLLVSPADRANLRIVRKVRRGLADNPVVDDGIFSEVESNECAEVWANCYTPRERLAYIREHGHDSRPGFRMVSEAVRAGSWPAASSVLNSPADLIY
jgi:hypothetical protein